MLNLRAVRATFGSLIVLAVAMCAVGQMPGLHQHGGSVPPATVDGATFQSAETRAMQHLLEKVFRGTDWKLDPSKPGERVAYYRKVLEQGLSVADNALVSQQLAVEQLSAGDSEGAVETLEGIRRRLAGLHIELQGEARRSLGELLGVAFLRLGEQQNCSMTPDGKACIFPLQASAVHRLPRGAQGAVHEFTALLEKDPDDAEARWLLNLAEMQLGRYPAGVPKRFLLPPAMFQSDRQRAGSETPSFENIAAAAGVDVTGHAGGVVMEDFDHDGWLDLMVSSSGPLDPMHLFHNNHDGTFTDIASRAGLTGETGGLNLVLTDYNNDGWADVLVLRGGWWGKQGCYPMSLLRNNGDGTFTDVTVAAGLLSMHPTQTAAWADFDGDGWLDLLVAHESTPEDPHPSQLFHNNHDGTFTDVAGALGLRDLGFVKGVAWGDYNNDGRPDLYVSVKGGRNRLFRNDGALGPGSPAGPGWRFTDVTAKAGVAQQSNSFATWFFDFDNDGWPDIFVGGYSTESVQDVGRFEAGLSHRAETPRLYRNNKDGTFTDVARTMHLDRAILPMGANFGDLDNDGWLDVYLGTGDSTYQALLPNRMFRNDAGQRFEDVTTVGGFGHLQKGHGIAFGDLFHTGHEDVFEEMGGAQPGDTYQSALYRNPGNANHWIALRLEGVRTNRAAFGARIDVTVSEPGKAARHIFRTVGYGSSFGGNPLEQHIGIGAATGVDRIELSWPVSGSRQVLLNLPGDRTYRVKEGLSVAERLR